MKKHFKKTMAMLLICCLSLCIWSASAFAAGTGEFDPIGNILPDPSFEENENDVEHIMIVTPILVFAKPKAILTHIPENGPLPCSVVSRRQPV